MNSVDFVKHIIDEMVNIFPSIQCSYQFKIESNTHFIEIIPSSVYNFDKKYARTETEATIEFIELYPNEGLCFITDDAIVKLDNPIYVKRGAQYALFPNVLPQKGNQELMGWKTLFNVETSQNVSLFDAIKGFVPTQVQSLDKNIPNQASLDVVNPSNVFLKDSLTPEEELKYSLVA